MIKLLLIASFVLILIVSCLAFPQRRGFTNIGEGDFKSRLEAALKRGRSQMKSFWVAYSFDVRAGVAIDAEIITANGSKSRFYGTVTSAEPKFETRNLAVFLLCDSNSDAISQVEIYNLDRNRDYNNHTVYWLGKADAAESLAFLKNLVETNQSNKIYEQATVAIGVHSDLKAGTVLEEIIRNSSVTDIRAKALFWLSKIPGEKAFLSELVRNDQESLQVRKEAAFALGMSMDAGAITELKDIYSAVTNQELKNHIIFSASMNNNVDEAVDFLITVTSNDSNIEARKQAMFGLSQKADQRSLDTLGAIADNPDVSADLQQYAVFAISRNPQSESVPLLIRIANSHPKQAVRKEAIFWLGRTDDKRATEALKQILTK